MTGVIEQLLATPTGIAGTLVMGLLMAEAAGLCVWAERHRRAALRLQRLLGRPDMLSDDAEHRSIRDQARRYLAHDLRRTISALEMAEDLNPKAGMFFTFASVGLLLPSFVEVMMTDPFNALAPVAPAIWTSVAGLGTAFVANVQLRRVHDEAVALDLALEDPRWRRVTE